MTTTPRFALRSPNTSDAPNVPQDIGFLASDVETWLSRAMPATSGARPTGVPDGFLIRETDTGNLMMYNASGSAWVQIGGTGGGGGGGGGFSAIEGQWTPSSAQSVGTALTVVAFGTQEISSSVVTRSVQGAGHRFTMTEAGGYIVGLNCRFDAGNAGRRFVEVQNSAQTARFASNGGTVDTGDELSVHLSFPKRFNAGDSIIVVANQTGQTTLPLRPTGSDISAGFVRINIVKVSG
jgi:hypothetical protein